VSLVFRPAAAGVLTASLTLGDDAAGSPQTVALTGTGTSIGPTFTASPASIDFPSTAVGAVSPVQVVTFTNRGASSVTITSISITGADASSFLRTGTSCPSLLGAGGSCTVSLVFKPDAAGALTASLALGDNAAGSPQTVVLSGTGTASASGLAVRGSTR